MAAFSLPAATRQGLLFDYTDPAVFQAFTAPYVHLGASHLAVNVLGYAVVVPVAYVLSVASGHRRRFLVTFVTFVLVFPILLSYLNLAVVRSAVGLGFSGIVMAFVGYLPIALAGYLDEQVGIGSTESLAPVLYFLGVALMAVLSVQSVEQERATVVLGTSGLVLAAVLSALWYWLSTVEQTERFVSKAKAAAAVPGRLELLAIGGFLFVGFPFVAFPPQPVGPETVLNIYVHLLGYSLGFIATYATIQTGARLPWASTSL